MKSSNKNPLVSVIIPTKNEERNISRCLDSIMKNGYPNYEIIVVDQESTDNTKKICDKFEVKFISVKKSNIYQPPSQSRNTGFEHSKGKFIFNLDADMELSRGLIGELVQLMKNDSVSAIIVPEEDKPLNYWARVKAYERKISQGTKVEAARFSRSSVFSKTKYDKNIFSGEDWNIHNKFKELGTISRSKKVIYHHIGKISIFSEFRKKYQYGYSSIHFVNNESKQIKGLFFTLLASYITSVTKTIIVDPLLVFGFVILRLVDLIALTAGYVSASIFNTNNIK